MYKLLRNRWVHLAVVATALVWVFEYVPVEERLPPSLMILHSAARALRAVAAKAPSWVGLWTPYLPTGKFHPLAPTGEEVRAEAAAVRHYVDHLRERTFFRIFKVDLERECPFWARENLCSSPEGSCTVCECDEHEIPQRWKEKPVEHYVDHSYFADQSISPWKDPESNLLGSVGEWENEFLQTMSGEPENRSSYVDLMKNPPGFTDYKGRNIWGLVYKDNCIRSKDEYFSMSDPAYVPSCSEEDVYERMVSGLQTVIMVLASEYNKPYNMWKHGLPLLTVPNTHKPDHSLPVVGPARYKYSLDLYRWRVNVNPRWVDNLYLDFSILLRTLARLHPIISSCGCYTGTDADDRETHALLEGLVNYTLTHTQSGTPAYANMPIFQRKQELALQQMNNISRIFDCIDCEKCRLHGKVKLTALQVATKSLGDPSDALTQRITQLERNEITALINAIGYFGDAIAITSKMQRRVLALRRLALTAAIWLSAGGFYALRRFSSRRRVAVQPPPK